MASFRRRSSSRLARIPGTLDEIPKAAPRHPNDVQNADVLEPFGGAHSS